VTGTEEHAVEGLGSSFYKWNASRYFPATSTASSTLSTLVPLPILVGALPPALPPTIPETVFAQSLADAPFLLASYDGVSKVISVGKLEEEGLTSDT